MDNYSDNLDVEVLLFKEEYDEKFSQVTEEIYIHKNVKDLALLAAG
jgi:hypothetical protein